MVRFIATHRDTYGVEPICAMLPIAPSLYYELRARQRDPERRPRRVRRDEVLSGQIRRVLARGARSLRLPQGLEATAAAGRVRCPLHGGAADAPTGAAWRDSRPKVQDDDSTGHRRGAAARSRHASVRGDATESTVGRGSDVRRDVARVRLRRLRDRYRRPPDRRLARVGRSWQTRFSGRPRSRRYSILRFNRDWDIPTSASCRWIATDRGMLFLLEGGAEP
jgi:hypothetical protein